MALDKYGNAVEEAAYETFDGYTEKVGGVKYDYVYDDNGNPLELVVSVYDYESDEYFLDQKFVYDGYSDVAAGIDGVLSSCVDSFTVYNLQGMLLKQNVPSSELSTLPEGLYIVNGKKLYSVADQKILYIKKIRNPLREVADFFIVCVSSYLSVAKGATGSPVMPYRLPPG